MTMFIDRREETEAHRREQSSLVPLLRKLIVPASDVEVVDLHSADIAHNGNGPGGSVVNIGYEIKHVADVLQCMDDGRLAGVDGQLAKMRHDYTVRWLVIEDEIKPDPDTGLLMKRLSAVRLGPKRGRGYRKQSAAERYENSGRWVPALYGASKSVRYETLVKYLTISCYQYHTMLWRTSSRAETALWLAAQYRMWNDKLWEQHKSIRTFNASSAGDKQPMYMSEGVKRRAKVMMGLEVGAGFEKACEIARQFKSVDQMMAADADRLRKIDGIGKVIANKIVDARSREER